MEYITGFLLGYFIKELTDKLKKISKYDNDSTETWDFLSYDDLP